MVEISSYRDIKIWQAAIDLAERVYSLSQDFPKAELYGPTSQARRAAVSIAANIAEGHGRETTGAFIQFLRMTQGSLKELETHLIIARRSGFAEPDTNEKLLAQCDELGRMVRGLIRSLQDKQNSA